MTDKFAILLFHSDDIYKIKEGFSLKKGENSIGSDPDCDIVLNFNTNEIENFHCKITCYEDYDDISIEDISINHNLFKFVNNKKIKLKKRKKNNENNEEKDKNNEFNIKEEKFIEEIKNKMKEESCNKKKIRKIKPRISKDWLKEI